MRASARLLRLLAREDGIALVMAIGILAVLTLTGVALIYYANSNTRNAAYSKEAARARDIAEGGINEMMAVLSNPANSAVKGDLLPATTHATDGGTVTWSGTFDALTKTWNLVSTGTVANPTGPGAPSVQRTLTATVSVTTSYAAPPNSDSWDYIYSTKTGDPDGCDLKLNNNVTGTARMYVSGNLCLGERVTVTASPLVVKGNIQLDNNAIIGSSKSRVEAYVGGGCKYGKQHWHWPLKADGHRFCSDTDRVYSKLANGNAGVSQQPPAVDPPVVEWDRWYRDAVPGPMQDCTSGNGARSGSPPVWDNNALRNDLPNGSVTGVFELTPTSSYTCRVGPANDPIGELSWNASTRKLTVRGTVYVDGSLRVGNNAANEYDGYGTIYLSGTLLLNGKLCAVVKGSECDFSSNWDPNVEMLALVAGGDGAYGNGGEQVPAGIGVQLTESSQLQGAIYATSGVQFDNNAKLHGPIIASEMIFSNNVVSNYFPLTKAPTGMPGTVEQVYASPNAPQYYSD